ncbi:hypothetical protein E2562_033662 [Oryza meyeriana var. granulata]|uniref:Uncharacterized protein n=1 Tax=Oryza meyeriana var. granulata TaxID=110450 RepID=A0A6G1CAQ3_9ORYZ|nr:hypothetical protein E2562_033662 [Oryza meyeriana var. granulata]
MDYSVVEARAWMHRGRLGCLVFLRDEEADIERMARIEACLGHLLRGGDSTSRAASPTSAVSVQSWAEHGYHSVPE